MTNSERLFVSVRAIFFALMTTFSVTAPAQAEVKMVFFSPAVVAYGFDPLNFLQNEFQYCLGAGTCEISSTWDGPEMIDAAATSPAGFRFDQNYTPALNPQQNTSNHIDSGTPFIRTVIVARKAGT